jgi:hypothetical protein
MEPRPLRPAVEMPVRRGRPAAVGAALALLFSLGAYNYMASTRGYCPYAGVGRSVELTFTSQPEGADVVRERDGVLVCRTPCRVDLEAARPGVIGFRISLVGYEDRRVLVDLRGGDTRIDVLLDPAFD